MVKSEDLKFFAEREISVKSFIMRNGENPRRENFKKLLKFFIFLAQLKFLIK